MKSYLSKIFFALEKEDIHKASFIFFLTLICSVAELISIGLIIPILHLFAGDELQSTLYFIPQSILGNTNKLLLIILGSFAFIYLIKFYLTKTLIKLQNSFSHNLFAKTSKKFFKLYLNKNFNFFVQNNSSDLIRNTMSECNLYSMGVVFSLIQLISEIIIFSFISIFLILYNFQISLIVILMFSIIGGILFKKNANNLKFWGNKRQHHSSQALKQLQQSFGSFRELIMNNLIDIFYNNYSFHTEENAFVGIKKDTVTQMPRLILEILAVFVLVLIVYFLILQDKSLPEILVLLGVFFYCTIRLLPSVSKIVKSIQNIRYNHVVIDVIYQGIKDYKKLPVNHQKSNPTLVDFNNFKKINFENVDFAYSNQKTIFKGLNFQINKGDKIGIIGKTGSGKSTFINILCGLLDVTSGKVYTDDPSNEKNYKSIQKMIGYVPQTVSVFDESLLFNVCLTDEVGDKDLQKFLKVIEIVDLKNLMNSLPNKSKEPVGENGSRLSGGQNQRLGIARAIFKGPEILILDEATSALDVTTEQKILNNLISLKPNMTVITISHRQTSLKFCDKIYEVSNLNLNLQTK